MRDKTYSAFLIYLICLIQLEGRVPLKPYVARESEARVRLFLASSSHCGVISRDIDLALGLNTWEAFSCHMFDNDHLRCR